MNKFMRTCVLGVGFGLVVAALGCGKKDGATPDAAATKEGEHAGENHSLEGGWCGEHKVPEEICAQCYPKVAAEFQKKGDWCEMHSRPNSQCFVCHPELEAKFAAQYEAKYGKKPPTSAEKEHEHEEKPKS